MSNIPADKLPNSKNGTSFYAIGFNPIVHSSATSGIFFSKEFHFDMVRAGISLYGLWPSNEIKEVAPKTKLLPVLSWKSIVTEMKKVASGERVGYDLTEKLNRDSVFAVVPLDIGTESPERFQVRVNFLSAASERKS